MKSSRCPLLSLIVIDKKTQPSDILFVFLCPNICKAGPNLSNMSLQQPRVQARQEEIPFGRQVACILFHDLAFVDHREPHNISRAQVPNYHRTQNVAHSVPSPLRIHGRKKTCPLKAGGIPTKSKIVLKSAKQHIDEVDHEGEKVDAHKEKSIGILRTSLLVPTDSRFTRRNRLVRHGVGKPSATSNNPSEPRERATALEDPSHVHNRCPKTLTCIYKNGK